MEFDSIAQVSLVSFWHVRDLESPRCIYGMEQHLELMGYPELRPEQLAKYIFPDAYSIVVGSTDTAHTCLHAPVKSCRVGRCVQV